MNDYLKEHINSIINDDCLNVLRQLDDNSTGQTSIFTDFDKV